MGWMRFLRRRQWDAERQRELEAYLAIETDENVARGLTPEAAAQAAQRKLGNRTRVLEEIHDMNSIALLDTLWQDLRYAIRVLRLNPGFAAVAVLSLGLGIGANTAIFQLIDAVRLRTLPVADPGALVDLNINSRGRSGNFNGPFPRFTNPIYEQLRDRQQVFSGLAAWGGGPFNLATSGEARYARGLWVSGNFFDVLGVRAVAGRLVTPADDQRGCASPGAVVSHAFWQRELGGAPAAIGRPLVLNGQAFDVMGVTPPGFFGVEVGRSFDVALPLCADALFATDRRGRLDVRHAWWLALIGRLGPGRSLEQADRHLRGLARGVFAATEPPSFHPDRAKQYLASSLTVAPASTGVSALRRQFGEPLVLLLAVTGLVLLIACANLASLLLARASAREQEMAVRLAIGASRRRLIRQLLVESLLLATLGAALGLVVAQVVSGGLVAALSTGGSRIFVDLPLDWRVAGFTAALACLTCLLFGVAPALRATRTAPAAAIRAEGRGVTAGREGFGLRRTLVVGQIALSVVLLLGALLFVRTLYNLMTVDTGVVADGVLVAEFDLSRMNATPEQLSHVQRTLIERAGAIPGVEIADRADIVPMSGNFWNESLRIDATGADRAPTPAINFSRVGPAYFAALGIPFVSGRNFNAGDLPTTGRVALVNQAFVRKHLKGASPAGARFQVTDEGDAAPAYQIVGVVRDTKYDDLREEFGPIVYVPASQETSADPDRQIVLRSRLPSDRVFPPLIRAAAEVHPAIGLDVYVLRRAFHDTLTRERLMALLAGIFGVLATFMATLGLYGVMSYMVACRRHEIGIRLALGAEARDVVRMMLRETTRLLVIGLTIGAGLALVAGRAARGLLFGLEPSDATTLGIALAVLAAAILLAGYAPAARASRLDPLTALRQD
jgi:putative ABC transport system permease protein